MLKKMMFVNKALKINMANEQELKDMFFKKEFQNLLDQDFG